MNSNIIKKLDNIISHNKFKRYIELEYYDSPNNFYAKIIKRKGLTDCELCSVYNEDDGSLSSCFFEYLPYGCVSSSRRCYSRNISNLIKHENEKILERICELNTINNSLDHKKQISLNKKVRYLNILENIKDNKDYRYRKFKKSINIKLTNILDKLDSRYFEHYNVIDYELAIKDNNKVLNKIDKFIRRTGIIVNI